MPLTQITGGGAFTRTNINDINSNFAAVTMPDYWVKPQGPNASDTNPGTYEAPFATPNGANQYLKPGVIVGVLGTVFGNWAPPAVNDITIIGMGTRPRNNTSSSIPNGGSASFISLATPAAADLIKVGGSTTETAPSQGWKFINLFFRNASTSSDTACVGLYRGDGAGADVGRDASHASFIDCNMNGLNYGLADQGGCGFVTVDNCYFYNFNGSASDTAIKQGASSLVAAELQWNIRNSSFWNNVNHIVMSLSSANIHDNDFSFIGSSITTTKIYDATGGKNNAIWRNKIGCNSDAVGITAAVTLGTADSWGPQYYSDKEEYATPSS